MTHSQPDMSVVVGLVSGAPDRLRNCLSTLSAQDGSLDIEILVPYDEPVRDVLSIQPDFPAARFIFAEGLDTSTTRSGGSREHHDSLRTLGLREARGRIVAMIEDVGRPARQWCKELVNALDRHPSAGAVGGAMSCGSSRYLNRAICFVDYWRYYGPLPDAPSDAVSDANVAYRRAALMEVRAQWENGHHETRVLRALSARGYEVRFAPGATVFQERGELALGEALRERFVWGRSFGAARVRDASLAKRLVYAAFCPVLPFLIASRTVRVTLERGGFWSRLVPVLPLILLLTIAWSWGEAVGYATARPD